MTARPAPSAGARHPCELEVLVHDVAGVAAGLWHFDPARASLFYRQGIDEQLHKAQMAVNAAVGLTSNPPVTVFAVAHMRRTLSRYPAGTTLVWRDAGVLLGLLHLTAAAADLASCIVGTGGILQADAETLVGDVGAIVVGRPRKPEGRSA